MGSLGSRVGYVWFLNGLGLWVMVTGQTINEVIPCRKSIEQRRYHFTCVIEQMVISVADSDNISVCSADYG